MPYKPADIERMLLSLGFVRDPTHEAGHRWYMLTIEGIPKTIRTKISHSKKEYGKGLESQIARQLHVRTDFFRALMAGKKTREDYLKEVKTNPFPPIQ